MGGDEPHRDVGVAGDGDREGAAAHLPQPGVLVVDLHRLQRRREVEKMNAFK
jgi:hypothetical protein